MINVDNITVEAAVRDMWELLLKPKFHWGFESAVTEMPDHVEALRSWVKALFDSDFEVENAVRRINPFIKYYSDLPPIAQKSNRELAKALALWWKQRR